jgi:hypothetical protein
VGVGRGDRRRGEVAQTMDIHVSKCKNDKIKERKKKIIIKKCLVHGEEDQERSFRINL